MLSMSLLEQPMSLLWVDGEERDGSLHGVNVEPFGGRFSG